MTILYTSKLKKGLLWITFFTILLAFFILKPVQATTIQYGFEECTPGEPLDDCGWSGSGGWATSSPVHSGNVSGITVGTLQYKSLGYGNSDNVYSSVWLYDYPYSSQGVNLRFGEVGSSYHSMGISFNDLSEEGTVVCNNNWGYTYGSNLNRNDWNYIEFLKENDEVKVLINGEDVYTGDCNGGYIGDTFTFNSSNGNFAIDDITIAGGKPPEESYLTIDNPASGSYASSSFPLDFTYNFLGEDANKMYIVFEAWNASSTCPIYGTDEWQTEYSEGWFYNQSLPYFSPRLTATSTEATSSISVYNLEQPYTYNCNYCYFYNEDTATSTLVNKCPDYFLHVQGYIPPSQPVPIGSWESYYASHTDSKFPTSTAIFDTISGSFSGIVNKLTSFINDFRIIFNSQSAFDNGSELGKKIPIARGYLNPINNFFGSLPVSELFMLVILILLVVVLYRIVARILHLIRG